MYEGLLAETIIIHGPNGDEIEGYYARPLGVSSVPSMVLIHHAPGWDPWCKEAARKLAYNGYATFLPHLYHRFGEGDWEDLAAASRTAGGVTDDQAMSDVEGAVRFLKAQPSSNGKVGVMGFCSGGRQTYLAACVVPGVDAAVDCWGGRVAPLELNREDPVRGPVVNLTPQLRAPLLGLFGNDDSNPDPTQVDRIEAALKANGKEYEFHRYDGAGHGFFATERPGYRQEQAVDGWKRVFAFLDKHLKRSGSAASQ